MHWSSLPIPVCGVPANSPLNRTLGCSLTVLRSYTVIEELASFLPFTPRSHSETRVELLPETSLETFRKCVRYPKSETCAKRATSRLKPVLINERVRLELI